jgi:8-oxo-dGTP diphosphatase
LIPDESKPHELVAGMLRADGLVLLCHRTASRRWYPDSWDLPGGHAEDDESRPQALRRELREELGIEISPSLEAPFAQVQGADFRMGIWVVDEWTGSVQNLAFDEHDELAWVDAREAAALRLADPRLQQLIEAVLS